MIEIGTGRKPYPEGTPIKIRDTKTLELTQKKLCTKKNVPEADRRHRLLRETAEH